MLEAIFQSLIDRILEVQNSHKDSSDKDAMLSRNWEFIFSDFDGWVVLYCFTLEHAGGYWIYPMLCPENNVGSLKEQLPSFSIDLASAAYHVMGGDEHWLEPCWGNPEDFTKSEIPLFFYRQYYGYRKGKENYHEFNQLVTHPLDLHWSATKNSYCRLDGQGDAIEKIKIIDHEKVSLILIRRRTLDTLLHLGKWVLVRYFAFKRFRIDSPSFSSCTSKQFEPTEYEAKFEIRTCADEYIEFRGAQFERPQTPKDQLLSWSRGGEEDEEERYTEFIVVDRKNNKLLQDYSIDPRNFANYFTESDLPFEISPIFFKAEVLDKYKNNPDKYALSERNISCRGGWYLKTYDINEHNQVHTYAVYLARLPYKEQLHWRQYNEEPKGGISKRAFRTDFEAKFSDERSKLELLKECLERLGGLRVGEERHVIWSPKGGSWDSASKGLHYVNSENPNQWHDFIIALANVTNEGFQIKALRKIASSLGNDDERLRTLGLIKFILQASNNEERIQTIHGVLNELQKRRGKGKAHGSWDTPKGSLIEDANKRLQDVIYAIEESIQVFGALEIPTQDNG
ncbi:MAG: hypothetical protein CEE38_11585 [Planctomycetes bacterium B3_Pla]|nr:MAG: hypothetical protein CEE38_11585 [Planctomycetes bacterium B3_Pla]